MALTRLADVDDLRARMDGGGSWTAEDTVLHGAALDAVTDAFGAYCGRHFGKTDSTAYTFTALHWDRIAVPDLVSVTSLKTDTTNDGTYDRTWSSTDYVLWPSTAASEPVARPYTEIRISTRTGSADYSFPLTQLGVEVTGVWGWPAVPDDVRNAAILEALRIIQQNRSPSGVVASPELGQWLVAPSLHPTTKMVLSRYRRIGQAHHG